MTSSDLLKGDFVVLLTGLPDPHGGSYGATRETDSLFPSLGYFTSFSKLDPLQCIHYDDCNSLEVVPNLSLPVWQIECGKEGMTGVT